jgi:hypothetical protein
VIGDTAVLESDLDCSAYDGEAVNLERSTLQMNGFTIRGNPALERDGGIGVSAVWCLHGCTIVGPGTVTGAGGGTSGGHRCCTGEAVSGDRVSATNLTIEGNGGPGIGAALRLTLDHCTIRNNAGYGAFWGGHALIRDTAIEDNGIAGAWAWRGGSVRLQRTTITGHPGQGLIADRARLIDTTITGNATDPAECDYESGVALFDDHCVDLYVSTKANASRVVCTSSFSEATQSPTGLCTND